MRSSTKSDHSGLRFEARLRMYLMSITSVMICSGSTASVQPTEGSGLIYKIAACTVSTPKPKQRWSLPAFATSTSCSLTAEPPLSLPSRAQLWNHCSQTLIPPKPIPLPIQIRIPCSFTILSHLNSSWLLEHCQRDHHSSQTEILEVFFTRRGCVSLHSEVESHFYMPSDSPSRHVSS